MQPIMPVFLTISSPIGATSRAAAAGLPHWLI